MKTKTVLIIIAALGLIVILTQKGQSTPSIPTTGSNVTITNGAQIIEIKAKGGYQPNVSEAKAGVPTVLRFQTNGTFDCSSTIRIPSLGVSQSLPPSGATDVALGSLQPGTLQGTCGMGMYRFEVNVRA